MQRVKEKRKAGAARRPAADPAGSEKVSSGGSGFSALCCPDDGFSGDHLPPFGADRLPLSRLRKHPRSLSGPDGPLERRLLLQSLYFSVDPAGGLRGLAALCAREKGGGGASCGGRDRGAHALRLSVPDGRGISRQPAHGLPGGKCAGAAAAGLRRADAKAVFISGRTRRQRSVFVHRPEAPQGRTRPVRVTGKADLAGFHMSAEGRRDAQIHHVGKHRGLQAGWYRN